MHCNCHQWQEKHRIERNYLNHIRNVSKCFLLLTADINGDTSNSKSDSLHTTSETDMEVVFSGWIAKFCRNWCCCIYESRCLTVVDIGSAAPVIFAFSRDRNRWETRNVGLPAATEHLFKYNRKVNSVLLCWTLKPVCDDIFFFHFKLRDHGTGKGFLWPQGQRLWPSWSLQCNWSSDANLLLSFCRSPYKWWKRGLKFSSSKSCFTALQGEKGVFFGAFKMCQRGEVGGDDGETFESGRFSRI